MGRRVRRQTRRDLCYTLVFIDFPFCKVPCVSWRKVDRKSDEGVQTKEGEGCQFFCHDDLVNQLSMAIAHSSSACNRLYFPRARDSFRECRILGEFSITYHSVANDFLPRQSKFN